MISINNLSNMNASFEIDVLVKNDIKYQIKLGKVKTLRIHFNKKNVLIISAPTLIKKESILNFINKNINWILEKNILINEKIIKYEQDTNHMFFGKKYILKINYSKTPRVDLVNDIIFVSSNEKTTVKKQIIEYRKEKSLEIFEEVLYQSFIKMKDYLNEYPKLLIKQSSTKWGCCYYKENKIMLNLALTQVPVYLIEYVVLHELVHFIYPNHSKEFHLFLQKYLPNERILAKELKKYSSNL